MREIWRATETAVRAESDAPRALRARIDEVQAAITKTRKALSTERISVLEVQESIGRELERIEDVVKDLGEARVALERELLVRESLPLWTALRDASEREPLSASLSRALAAQVEEFRAAWPPALNVWITVLLIGAVSVWFALLLQRRALRLDAEDPSFEATVRVFQRPYSVAAIVAVLGVRVVWGAYLPGPVEEVLRTLVLLPALRLLAAVRRARRAPAGAHAGRLLRDRPPAPAARRGGAGGTAPLPRRDGGRPAQRWPGCSAPRACASFPREPGASRWSAGVCAPRSAFAPSRWSPT